MSDHSELVAEITVVEKMSTQDRLKHAKKRRHQQLKKFNQYERQLDKEQQKKNKKNQGNKRPPTKKARTTRVMFDSNIMLLEAAARNDVDEVRTLLERGVSPDVTNEDGLTALHQCCIDDSEVMMRLLIQFGANVNARDSELWTPLHAAATCGHIHLCKYLIDKGAELLAVNADGNMPYDICEDETTLDFIESEMAKRGVTQELIDETRLSKEKNMLADLKMLADSQGDLEFLDRYGATPLHIAAANGYVQVVEFLLDQHVNVDVQDDDSWQPIHAAACWGQLPILEMLVHSGADLDAKTKTGETPHDICEEPELKQRILEMRDEMESNRATKSSELKHRRSQNTRSSTMSNSASSLYSSNTSLTGDKNPFRPSDHSNWPHSASSASVRRTSMREKSALSWKEAREEAKMMRGSAASDEEEEGATNDQQGPTQQQQQQSQQQPDAPTASHQSAGSGPVPTSSESSQPTSILTPASGGVGPRAPHTPPPKQQPHRPPTKAVVIEEIRPSVVPTTNIDDVTVSTERLDRKKSNQANRDVPKEVGPLQYQLDQEREKEKERQMNETNTTNSSDMSKSSTTNNQGLPLGSMLITGSVAPPQGTLADLKKQRLHQLQTQLHRQRSLSGSQDMFAGSNTNGNGSLVGSNSVLPHNGHSPSLSEGRANANSPTGLYIPPPPKGEPPIRRYTATSPSEIVGGENGKQNCCIIL